MIYNIPIEPYEARYTEQWFRWWPDAFKDLGIEFRNIHPTPLTNVIEHGEVLDAIGTNYTKAKQLASIVEKIGEGEIKSGDVLFFHDLWFPGLEALAYIRHITGIQFKITGILHAGTYDINDFTYRYGMRPWGSLAERCWLELVDAVFVATSYHAQLLIHHYGHENKIHVTGLPFVPEEVMRIGDKENIVVFPHRMDPEKRPEMFTILRNELEDLGWTFVCSVLNCETKDEYYDLLGRAKIAVSCALQETFGYAMLEAAANGCVCVMPDKLSYNTMGVHTQYGAFYFDSIPSDLTNIVRSTIASVEGGTARTVPIDAFGDLHPTRVLMRIGGIWNSI